MIEKVMTKLKRMKRRMLSPRPDAAPGAISFCRTPLGDYYLPANITTDIVINAMRAGQIFEPYIVDLAKAYISPGSVVLDVGANFGQMTILFSQFTGEGGRVYSFEADDFVYGLLEKNIAANNRKNVMAVFGAVHEKQGETFIFPVPDFQRFGSYGSYGLDPRAKEGRKVQSLTIDNLNIEGHISFMKVDIQGCDLFALRGAVETIRKHKMPIIFEYEEDLQEQFGTSFDDYMKFLESVSYKVKKVVGGINYLVVPRH